MRSASMSRLSHRIVASGRPRSMFSRAAPVGRVARRTARATRRSPRRRGARRSRRTASRTSSASNAPHTGRAADRATRAVTGPSPPVVVVEGADRDLGDHVLGVVGVVAAHLEQRVAVVARQRRRAGRGASPRCRRSTRARPGPSGWPGAAGAGASPRRRRRSRSTSSAARTRRRTAGHELAHRQRVRLLLHDEVRPDRLHHDGGRAGELAHRVEQARVAQREVVLHPGDVVGADDRRAARSAARRARSAGRSCPSASSTGCRRGTARTSRGTRGAGWRGTGP